jgi:hypothetical protein
MPMQERELGRNYIGILSEKTEEECALEALPKSDRLMKNYFRDLIAVVLKRQSSPR